MRGACAESGGAVATSWAAPATRRGGRVAVAGGVGWGGRVDAICEFRCGAVRCGTVRGMVLVLDSRTRISFGLKAFDIW